MFGRKKTRSLSSSFSNSLKNNIINDIRQDMYEDRPRYIPNEPQYSIPLLPKGIMNYSIPAEQYNALPRWLRHSWQRIDLDELFKEEIEELEQTPKEALMENPLVKENDPLRSLILSETKETEDQN